MSAARAASLGAPRRKCATIVRQIDMLGVDAQDALVRAAVPHGFAGIQHQVQHQLLQLRQQTLGCGAKACLRKPVDEAMLLDAIRTAMGQPASS